MMLAHLGYPDSAQRLEDAIGTVYKNGKVLTLDQGGSASTTDFCAAVAAQL
jgi:isocitrate/isopropylmalate dehydrogenase